MQAKQVLTHGFPRFLTSLACGKIPQQVVAPVRHYTVARGERHSNNEDVVQSHKSKWRSFKFDVHVQMTYKKLDAGYTGSVYIYIKFSLQAEYNYIIIRTGPHITVPSALTAIGAADIRRERFNVRIRACAQITT